MLLDPSPDQEFLRETTAKFLANTVPSSEVRRLRRDPAGFDAGYWRQGAELGWVTFLVPEAAGGGSVSGDGLVDLTLIAHEIGMRAAPGPLLPCNIVASALAAGGEPHAEVVAELVAGTATAAWCLAEAGVPATEPDRLELTVRAEGDELVLDGVKRPVEAGAQAAHLLVTGRTGDGLSQVLVPAGTAGVTARPLESVDLTRRFAEVRCEGARVPASCAVGELGGAAGQVEHQLRQALVINCAEAVGAMQAAFDLTVAWAFERYSFGRPLASYQALKHRFADMLSWLHGAHAAADAAAAAVSAGSTEADELASVAKAFIGTYGGELVQDCVQLHGGMGVTYDLDIHLWLRRVTLNRSLFGTPAEHKRRITDLLERKEAAA